ncbi:Protein of uncharacterised function (DUF2686) [Escherichia coli]|nr:Protein of uncharacterised function (DUF2686) [Escherichia coli]
MSMPLSNALQSQIITDAHFLHHPIVDSEFTRKLKYARMDSENIRLLLVAITIITMEKALSKLENLILVKSPGHLIM